MTRCAVCDGSLSAGRIVSPDRLHGLPGTFEVRRCALMRHGPHAAVGRRGGSGRALPGSYAPHADAEGPGGAAALAARAIHRWQEARMLSTPALHARALAGAGAGPGRGLRARRTWARC